MHIHHDHVASGEHSHDHIHTHSHEHTHDGVTHSHPHAHAHEHGHTHPHDHDALHGENTPHDHSHDCDGGCASCGGSCAHTPMEELTALMQYMVNHNAAHARELEALAAQLEQIGNKTAYEQVMAAVADFEKGNMRLSVVLASLK